MNRVLTRMVKIRLWVIKRFIFIFYLIKFMLNFNTIKKTSIVIVRDMRFFS